MKRNHAALAALAPLALCLPSAATASPSPAGEPTAIVYAADPLTNVCTNRALYYVRGTRVFGADAATGRPTNTLIRYIDGDRIYATDTYLGARTGTVLRYIEGNRVYAADVRGAKTSKILSYIRRQSLRG